MKELNYKFYKNSFDEHGVSAKGVHWNSKESQYIRFEIITNLIKDFKNSSIIDLGCGYGEYLNYLNEKNLKPDIYLGIDCEEFILDIAKKRFPKNTFLKADILLDDILKADYYICSGTFNILVKEEFLKAISQSFKRVNKALIFNCLSQKSMHSLSIEEIYSFCKSLTPKVAMTDDYLHNDVTFLLET